ncbi:acyl-CoA thioesterase II [Streptomyces sp. NPDC047315]|uniref:acyl-CoA thioesterase n=1 Tax=Streptomyces sp. NPDC047315 TaxID=3155142 RepID=UPI003410F843
MRETVPAEARSLTGFLSLERLDRDLFRGWCHEGLPLRAFGGQVAAQALTAAGGTVGGGGSQPGVHSLHGYFLRGGDPARPIVYSVERLRDGRTFFSRRVTALQNGEVIFTLSASFKSVESGYDRQPAMPATPDPDAVPDLFELWAQTSPADFEQLVFPYALEVRRLPEPAEPTTPGLTEQKLWIRATDPLGDDPLLHACALAYASDLLLAPTAALWLERPRPLREEPSSVFMTSLDHAIWYHRPFRADEWLLFSQRSPSATDGRGLAFADVWGHDGRLIAHVVQEAVLRPAGPSR